jgi:hypothetical protein
LLTQAVELLDDETTSQAQIDQVLSDCVAENLSVAAELLRVRRRWEELVVHAHESAAAGREAASMRMRFEQLAEMRDELSMTIAVLRERRELPIRFRPGLPG